MRKFFASIALVLIISGCEFFEPLDFDIPDLARIDTYNPELHIYAQNTETGKNEPGATVILYERESDYRNQVNAVDTLLTDSTGLAKFVNLKDTCIYYFRIRKGCFINTWYHNFKYSLRPYHRQQLFVPILGSSNLKVFNRTDSIYQVVDYNSDDLPVPVSPGTGRSFSVQSGSGTLLAFTSVDTRWYDYTAKCDSIYSIVIE